MEALLILSVMLYIFIFQLSCQKKSAKTRASDNNAANIQDSNTTEQDQHVGGDGLENELIDGPTYFTENVAKAFQICQRCHAPDDYPVERDRGPMSIYEYQPMLSMLEQNTLLPMIRGTLAGRTHPNRDPCLSGINSSPCKEVAEWWDIEFGNDPEKAGDRPLSSIGAITEVTADGFIKGWAINAKDLNQQVNVQIAINDENFNNPIQIPANQDSFDNGNPGAHGFEMKLPATWLNGQRHLLAARIALESEFLTIEEAPESFIALDKPAAGSVIQQYFTANVLPTMMTDCGCHGNGLNYDFLWLRLITPFPAEGGNASNNRLRLKASGGLGHSGGDLCGGTNVCQIIEDWWDVEFGNGL